MSRAEKEESSTFPDNPEELSGDTVNRKGRKQKEKAYLSLSLPDKTDQSQNVGTRSSQKDIVVITCTKAKNGQKRASKLLN